MLSIIGQIFQARMKMCLIYKNNFILNLFFNSIWTVVQIVFINIIFLGTSQIGEWEKNELLLFFGIDEIIFPLFIMFSYSSWVKLEQMVNDGTIDYVLLQPMNEKIYLSIYNVDFFQVPTIIFGVFLTFYSLINLEVSISMPKMIFLFMFTVSGVWILNSVFTICVSLIFKYRRLNFLKDIILSFISAMSYPLDIYKGLFKVFITTILPIGILVHFPVKMLLEKLTLYDVIYYLIIAILFFILQKIIWKKMLSHYTSSSS